ncbi:MAG TPA: low temperature requirement protein A [Vicinamibacterales bacterium]|nr:low temperature requirement protein A [Vicinamibacterales bacterium]
MADSSPTSLHGSRARLHVPMRARSPHEPHRVATPLELLFDLVFVVAIAEAASGLHHAVAEAHVVEGLTGYAMVFFAIWWAWMNFTWFASAYDTDDVPYRLTVFVQITGALIVAGGIPAMFEARVPNLAVIGGYVVMRMAMVVQWLRAAGADRERCATARRYAAGIAVMQVLWVGTLFLPSFGPLVFAAGVIGEIAVPLWAERASRTLWHPHHIAERYGLLTLIVFGESILSATAAVQSAVAAGERVADLAPIIAGGMLIVYSLWWIYFDRPAHDLLRTMRRAFVWGYGHYFVFASAAAVGAGLGVAVDRVGGHAAIGPVATGMAVAIPVASFLIGLWILNDRPEYARTRALGLVTAAIVLAMPFTPEPVLWTGVTLAALVAVKLALRRNDRAV